LDRRLWPLRVRAWAIIAEAKLGVVFQLMGSTATACMGVSRRVALREQGAVEMTRMGMAGSAVAAALVLSVVATASAFAAEAELTAEGGSAAKGITFTSKAESGSTLVLQSVKAGSKIICTAETSTGTVTGPQTAYTTVTFTGCESSVSGKKCQSGSTSGQIISSISSKLGFISTSKKEYGESITPSPATKFECGAAFKIEVKSSFIASILKTEGSKAVELEKPFLTVTISAKQEKGVQNQLCLEEGASESLLEASENGGSFEMAGEEVEVLQTYSKKVEFRG
jgi:hypothetical protein